ncbi:MAG: hypothetical protein CMO61_02390 [Verrucomicrobiales bacterium]|nr:hypothetical protein [Verrucomicrobiales bacterium]
MQNSSSLGKLGRAIASGLALGFGSVPLMANPTGAIVQTGDISFVSQGTTLEVHQGTQNGIINWDTFSINDGEKTRFIQPGPNSATLNRVTGSTRSVINGNLFANGRVFLLNSNGVLVGSEGFINVAGFTASTLEMSDEDLLGGGDMSFHGSSQATVVNEGSILAFDGDVFLVAAQTKNLGKINAANGTVGLVSGNDVLISESGSERVFVRAASEGEAATETEAASGVVNQGTIDANVAELKAHGGNVYGMAVKNEGRVVATSISREGGQIFLRSGAGQVQVNGMLKATRSGEGGSVVVDAGSGGLAEVGGHIDVSGTTGFGGSVAVTGEQVEVLEDGLIVADGVTGGGEIRIGGGMRGAEVAYQNAATTSVGSGAVLSASSLATGNGGMVIAFADKDLFFQGTAKARGGVYGGDGGFIELSGKKSVTFPGFVGSVDAGASMGETGQVLFDPVNIDLMPGYQGGDNTDPINASPVTRNTLYAGDISDFLASELGNLTVTTDIFGHDPGTISVFDGVDVSWNSSSSLNFYANSEFLTQGAVSFKSEGSGGLEIYAKERIQLGGSQSTLGESTLQTNSGLLKLQTGSGSTARGIFLKDAILSTNTGNIEIVGYNAVGDGTTVAESQILSTGGDITIEGHSTAANGNGLAFLSDLEDRSQVANTGGIIKLAGLGQGTGKAIVFNDTNAVHAANDFLINGDSSTEIELRSNGGDVILSHLTGDQVLFDLGSGASGSLNLVNADLLGQFQSPSSSGIFIENYNTLFVGDVSSSGPVNLQAGTDLKVEGQISSPQPVILAGGSGIELAKSVNAPGLNLVGGMDGIDVSVEGIFNLEGVTFTNVERVYGDSGGIDDVLIGSATNEEIGVSTNLEAEFPSENSSGSSPNTVVETTFTISGIDFERFDEVSGGGGNDTFTINLDEEAPFLGRIEGGSGDDRFVIAPGGDVSLIDGGAGIDVLDYSNFTDPVGVNFSQNDATQVGEVANLEKVVGGSGLDTFSGTGGNDQFQINGLNAGVFNDTSFDSFESLQGLEGDDTFLFLGGGSVDGINGDSGSDSFILDDSGLEGIQTYNVASNSVTRNMTYDFTGIEVVQLLLGPGNDTVNVIDNGKTNYFDGGAGIDTLNTLGGPLQVGTPITLGSSTIATTNFEFSASSSENTAAVGALLTAAASNQESSDSNDLSPGTVESNFSVSPNPGAFAALTTTATILGQAAVIQAGGQGSPPLKLDGSVGYPPVIVIDELMTNLESSAWIELASSIQFSSSLAIVMQDGVTSLNLADLPPEDLLPVLVENLRTGAAEELLGALELTMFIPLTSLDGAVSMLTVPIPVEPQILALLTEILGEDAFSELTLALGG